MIDLSVEDALHPLDDHIIYHQIPKLPWRNIKTIIVLILILALRIKDRFEADICAGLKQLRWTSRKG